MNRKSTMRALAATLVTASVISGLALTAGTASATATSTQTFVGFGFIPDAAHADAVRQMQAFSPTCVEVSTSFTEAGSEHFWQATLTADC